MFGLRECSERSFQSPAGFKDFNSNCARCCEHERVLAGRIGGYLVAQFRNRRACPGLLAVIGLYPGFEELEGSRVTRAAAIAALLITVEPLAHSEFPRDRKSVV